MASWFPRNVPVCAPGPHTSSFLLYITIESGWEPPIALETRITSGTIPAYSNAKSFPLRPIPHCISSTIRGMSSSFVTLRTVCRNFSGAGLTPPSPWIGSRITAAGFVIPLSGSLRVVSK